MRLTSPLAVDEGQFLRRGLAMHEREFDIAAKQWLALFFDAAFDRRRKAADHGNRRGAECQTGEKDPEALKA